VENPIKEVRQKKATGDDYVPGHVLKLIGEDGFRMRTYLINNMYEKGESPKDFVEVTMIALNETPKAIKCSFHHTISLCARACAQTHSKDSSEVTHKKG